MGVSRLFWPQELLDQWIVDEKISLEGERLTVQKENRTYRVRQAVFFTSDVGDGDDKHNLVGRVKELEQLDSMEAEHYMDSVLIEDSAYQVVTGFVGEQFPIEVNGAESGANKTKGTGVNQSDKSEEASDQELLAKFLIENL